MLPDDGSSAVDAPSGLIPSFAYTAAGTVVLGLVVGGLILLATCFWFASRRSSRLRMRIEPHLAHDAGTAKLRRQQGRAATRARLVDSIEDAFKNVRQFKQVARMIERADIPLRPGELARHLRRRRARPRPVRRGRRPLVPDDLLLMGDRRERPARRRLLQGAQADPPFREPAARPADHDRRVAEGGAQLPQGIQSVVDEGAEPAAKEFKRVLTETQLGRPIDDALADMAERVGSKNFTFVITAVTIQRQIGGSLAGLFDMVADTVRQRQQFARKIKGLTAMGRMSAYVLVGLPFFLARRAHAPQPDVHGAALPHADRPEAGLRRPRDDDHRQPVLKKIVSFRG